ncbi:MAG: tetratricopeptide repeat protein [Prevotellaceae bacterium]|jgi:tetratricopeptide (TPR) repeat protein|nr:tetratricopeptide repeat protein [Prevotellaceae bacterium]
MSKKQNKPLNPKANTRDLGEALSSSERFLEKHQKPILYSLSAVILIVLAVMLTRNYYIVPKQNEAQDKMVVCVQYFERDSFNLALNGDGINDGLLDIIDGYSITRAADLAALYAGACYYHLGQYEEALDCLQKFNRKSVNITPASIGLTGDCYVELNDYVAAAKAFEKAAKYDNDLTAPFYLKKAGIIYEELNDYSKAETVYQKIKDNYPQSQQAADVEKYIERAKVLQQRTK